MKLLRILGGWAFALLILVVLGCAVLVEWLHRQWDPSYQQ